MKQKTVYVLARFITAHSTMGYSASNAIIQLFSTKRTSRNYEPSVGMAVRIHFEKVVAMQSIFLRVVSFIPSPTIWYSVKSSEVGIRDNFRDRLQQLSVVAEREREAARRRGRKSASRARRAPGISRRSPRQPFSSDRERVEFLFSLYEKLTAPLLPVTKSRRKRMR